MMRNGNTLTPTEEINQWIVETMKDPVKNDHLHVIAKIVVDAARVGKVTISQRQDLVVRFAKIGSRHLLPDDLIVLSSASSPDLRLWTAIRRATPAAEALLAGKLKAMPSHRPNAAPQAPSLAAALLS